MAYVGRVPARGQNREIDDISSSFNGSTTAFTLQSGGLNVSPGSVNQLFVNLGGVMQNPGTDFTVSNYTITFTTAPASGLSFWAVSQGDAVDINTPADDSVTGAKLAVSLVAGDTLYASGADTLARLPKGTDGQVLKLASGLPSWAADAQDSTLTTQGDILYRDGSGYARLAAGTSGHFLKTQGSGANPVWAAGGVSNPGGTTSNTVAGNTAGAAIASCSNNTFFGSVAGNASNANNNTGFGADALKVTTSGGNTAIGKDAGEANTTGFIAFAGGETALKSNTTGSSNVACGAEALKDNTECNDNTACGYRALENIGASTTTAHANTAIGKYAGRDQTEGWNSTFLGANAQGSSATASNQITLGDSSVNSLRCNETSISSLSDQRDKTDVVNLPIGLNFVKSLRPVKFKWARRDPNDLSKVDANNPNNGKIKAGFLAQELQTAVGSDTYLDLVMDDNADRLEAKPGNLIPVLVQAIKELEARLATLEAA